MIDKIKSFTFFSIAAKICWGFILLIPILMGFDPATYIIISPRVNNVVWGSVFVLIGIMHAIVFMNIDMPRYAKLFSYVSLFIWLWLAAESARVTAYSTTTVLYSLIAIFDFIAALDCKTISQFINFKEKEHDKRNTYIRKW